MNISSLYLFECEYLDSVCTRHGPSFRRESAPRSQNERVSIESFVFRFHHVDPGHVSNALVISAFNAYNYRMHPDLALYDNIDLAKSLGLPGLPHSEVITDESPASSS